MVLFFKGLDRTKDLSSDAALARFLPMAIMTILFVGIQLQRLTVCFTSTTILVQLAFYVWAVECFLKVSILFGTIALLSFNKDFADKMKAKRRDSREYFLPAPVLCILFYGTFVVGISLRMILNELRKRDWEAERQREALLRIEKDMPPFPITTANRALMEKEAQKQLLRVRTWPRVFIGLYYAAELLDIANILLFKRDKLAELRWHVHLLNIVITICALNGLYALFRKSLRISRGCFSTYVAILFYDSYFRIKNLIKLYRNGNVSSSSIITTAADALTTEDSTVMKFPFAEAVLNAIVDFFLDLLLVWSMWQIVKDLEKRNERIAKAKFESRVAASNTTITDEKGATVYNERGQQSSVMWI
ncbi:hypothetical protein BG015_001797 [Linnemannia schmuckeri]|uniref:Uncharacterized protein n=1 Tax=Linnemannia schmuckeri TaxID=64567 RepID=A0A9P5RPA9_9FUNG|nr:hypothetical protein BG015_001797 [Linnemannia schmuckeri]